MKLPPFDAARRGGSNELWRILLRPLDAEVIDETQEWTNPPICLFYNIFYLLTLHCDIFLQG